MAARMAILNKRQGSSRAFMQEYSEQYISPDQLYYRDDYFRSGVLVDGERSLYFSQRRTTSTNHSVDHPSSYDFFQANLDARGPFQFEYGGHPVPDGFLPIEDGHGPYRDDYSNGRSSRRRSPTPRSSQRARDPATFGYSNAQSSQGNWPPRHSGRFDSSRSEYPGSHSQRQPPLAQAKQRSRSPERYVPEASGYEQGEVYEFRPQDGTSSASSNRFPSPPRGSEGYRGAYTGETYGTNRPPPWQQNPSPSHGFGQHERHGDLTNNERYVTEFDVMSLPSDSSRAPPRASSRATSRAAPSIAPSVTRGRHSKRDGWYRS